jgi:hypothetical protein
VPPEEPQQRWPTRRRRPLLPRHGCRWLTALLVLVAAAGGAGAETAAQRPRARQLGLEIGILAPGTHNAITDVAGVRVGHYSLKQPPRFNTGITAILPHGGDLFREKVPAAIVVGNGFGKLMGSTQVNELGEIETPILLTGTLNVPRVADGLIGYMLGPWPWAPWAPAREPSASTSRAASARLPVGSTSGAAAGRWGSWCRPTSAVR